MTSKGKDGVAQKNLWNRPGSPPRKWMPPSQIIHHSWSLCWLQPLGSSSPNKQSNFGNDGPLALIPNWWMTVVFEFGDVWGQAHFFQERRWGRPSKLPSRMKRPRERQLREVMRVMSHGHGSSWIKTLRIQFKDFINSRAIKRNWIGPNIGVLQNPRLDHGLSMFIILWNRNVVFLFFSRLYTWIWIPWGGLLLAAAGVF